MKVDVCVKREEHFEVCKDIQFCCTVMEAMNKKHFIEFTNHGGDYKATVVLNLRDYNRDYQLYGFVDRIPMINAIPINYCPFCGEKIET